jgi:hypothetical protein
MTTTVVKFKRSGTVGKIPTTADLDYGELAINYADGVIYYKNSAGAITSLSTGGAGGDALTTQIATDVAITMAIALG